MEIFGSRQKGRERGPNVIDVDYDAQEILLATNQQINVKKFKSSKIYGNGNSGELIAELISRLKINIEKKDFLT